MTHQEVVVHLAETKDPELRESIMAQYIITLEHQNYALKMELAKARTTAAPQYGKGRASSFQKSLKEAPDDRFYFDALTGTHKLKESI